MNLKKSLTLGAVIVLALMVCRTAPAQNTVWAGGSVGSATDWANPVRWSAGVPVAYTSNAYLSNTNITLGSSVTGLSNIRLGQVANSLTTLTFSGVNLTLTRTAGQATLFVGGGEYVRSDPSDPYSPFVLTGGENSIAHLNIRNGTKLSATTSNVNTPSVYTPTGLRLIIGGSEATSEGYALIEGQGTEVFASEVNVGPAGYGQMKIQSGAKVGITYTFQTAPITIFNSIVTIGTGQSPTNVGEMIVTGTGSELFASSLTMATGGSASLLVEQGAQVNVYSIEVGRYKNDWDETLGSGRIELRGDGTELNVLNYESRDGRNEQNVRQHQGYVYLGVSGEGQLLVADGAKFLNEGTVYLGLSRGSVYFGDYYVYDSSGVIQIGEDGGRAGSFQAQRITTGYGSGEVIFAHGDSDYLFSTPLLASDGTVGDAGRDEDGNLITARGLLKVTVQGGGRTTLSAANTYAGGTFINEGTLVAGHATALGTGRLEITSAGHLEIANTVTTLNLGETFIEGGSSLKLTVAANSLDAPRIEIAGALTLQYDSSNPWYLDLEMPVGFDNASTYDWTFLTATDGIYDFDESAFSIDLSGWSVYQQGNSLVLSYVLVPEVSRVLLVGVGLFILGGRRSTWRHLMRSKKGGV